MAPELDPDPNLTPDPPEPDGTDGLPGLLRTIVFFGLYAILIAIYLAIVPTLWGSSEFSGAAMRTVSAAFSIITTNIPAISELAPALLAGILVVTAPSVQRTIQVLALLSLSVVTYLLYLHFQIVIHSPGLGVDEAIGLDISQIKTVKAGLDSLTADARAFMAIIIGGLLGLQVVKTP